MRSWGAAVAAGLTSGVFSAIAVVVLLSRMWAACDVGINSSANALGLLLFTAPAVAVVGGVAGALAFWLIVRTGRRGAAIAACAGAACATLVVVWVAVAVQHNPGGDYPAPLCVDNIPPWWPESIPI
ncbi:hypothetical protein ORI20_21525 [Mycobacterium sp. CVI_P3]|uniref:Uncharacterized protein n=1 Tax=Mycobacterium pinniadriaticum TaxID=2994102 RepID=A0ABT3SIF8_9MYCO|nr:hypothetical protein [Mycobacterium pinniadriaticum]MCX2932858.1 hypothetical protein [Mycobacterium pinniadriaticum]MCX2939281.1 hypothetical protein [Mycobacterium pinniadriaticum]